MKSTTPAGPASPQAELAQQLTGLFERAADSAGSHDAFIDLAGRTVRLRFAGTELSDRVLPPVAHLVTEPGPPALTLHAWDSASTSTPPLSLPWDLDDFREQGIVRGYYGDGFYTVYEFAPKALNVVDAAKGEAFLWMSDCGIVRPHEWGAPLRSLLNLWLSGGDTQLVHGGAVGTPEGCVLIVGPPGAGKSSTVLSCLGSGLGHIGEDYCLVTRGDPPMVSSLYSSAKLSSRALARLPHLANLDATMPGMLDLDSKALVNVGTSADWELLRSAPLAAIAVPEIDDEAAATTAEACSAREALAAVGPSTMLQLPGNGEASWRFLTDLVRSVPCHRLRLGSDPGGIPPAIERLLENP